MHCAVRWLALFVSRLQLTSARTIAGRRWRTHVGFETAVANMGERCSRGCQSSHAWVDVANGSRVFIAATCTKNRNRLRGKPLDGVAGGMSPIVVVRPAD